MENAMGDAPFLTFYSIVNSILIIFWLHRKVMKSYDELLSFIVYLLNLNIFLKINLNQLFNIW